MATTYAQLKRQLQLLIDRTDAETQEAEDGTEVDVLDDFIRKAEQRFYRSEAARIPPMEKFVDFALGVGTGSTSLAIPRDYFETRYLTLLDSNGRQFNLRRTSPDQVLNVLTSASYDIPREFAYGNNEWLIRSPAQPVTIRANYYGFLDSLASQTQETTTHWLLNNGDDLILYWAAVDSALYFGGIDPTMRDSWEQRAQIVHDQIVEQETRQQQSGTTPRINRPYRSIRSQRYGFPF